jgi:hypothetical protein
LKRVVLNHKKSQFVGNALGGHTAPLPASLTSTCGRHQVDLQLYLTQLLMDLPTWPARDLDAWLADQWKLHHTARLATLNQHIYRPRQPRVPRPRINPVFHASLTTCQ